MASVFDIAEQQVQGVQGPANVADNSPATDSVFDVAEKRTQDSYPQPSLAKRATDWWNKRVENEARLGIGLGAAIAGPPMALASRGIHAITGTPTPDSLQFPMGVSYPISHTPIGVAGDVVQTGASLLPFTKLGQAAFAARPIATSAGVGGALGIGQGMSQNEGTIPTLGRGVVAAGLSAAIPAVASADFKNPGDYIMPWQRSRAVGQDIAEQLAEKRSLERGLRNEASSLQAKKTELGTELAGVVKSGKLDLQTLEDQLDAASQGTVKQLKQQAQQVSENMTTTYGSALDTAENRMAAEGKTIDPVDYRAKVVQPILDQMDEQSVPRDSRIYKTIDSIAKPVEAEEGVAAQGQQEMSLRDFPKIRKTIMDTVSGQAKGGGPSNLYDRYAFGFNKLHGDYLKIEAPEIAPVVDAYGDMATVRKWLYRKTQPFTDQEMDGSVKLLNDLHSGNLTPTANAMIKLAEEGKGPIPGIGTGQLGQATQEQFSKLSGQQQAYKMVYDQTKSQLAVEQDTLKNQILNIQKRLKGVQVDRADVAMRNESIDQLRIKQARLNKIAAWQVALGLSAYGAYKHGNMVPVVKNIINVP